MQRFLSWRRAGAIAVFAFLSAPLSVSADTLFGVYAGAGTWQQNYSGDIRSGVTDIDVEDDLGLDDESNSIFYVAVEHPVPVLPNVRVNYVDLSLGADNVLTRSIDFNGVIFPVDTAISTDLDVTQGDAVVYYEVLDNLVSLDLGLGARYMDGSVELVSEASFSEAEFTAVVPMLYGRTRADLPFSGFWMGAEVMGMGYSDNNLIDANAQIGWESPFGLGAEAGWRLLSLDIDDLDDFDESGINISGPYVAINFHI